MPGQDSLMWWQVRAFPGLAGQHWRYGAGNGIMPKSWRQPNSWPHFMSLRTVRVGRAISRWRCSWPPMVPTSPCWLHWQSSSAGTLSPPVRDSDDLEAPVQGWESHLNPTGVPCGPEGISWPSLQIVLQTGITNNCLAPEHLQMFETCFFVAHGKPAVGFSALPSLLCFLDLIAYPESATFLQT